MITAPTYQFQGWLSSLDEQPPPPPGRGDGGRRWPFVLIFQLPNLVNLYYIPRGQDRQAERAGSRQHAAEVREDPEGILQSGRFRSRRRNSSGSDQGLRSTATRGRGRTGGPRRRSAELERIDPDRQHGRAFRLAAAGRDDLGRGATSLPALLGLAGMTLIGSAASGGRIGRRSTQFQGQVRTASPGRPRSSAGRPVERWPALGAGCSRPACRGSRSRSRRSRWGDFQSLLRSPEAKIALLMPLIMGGRLRLDAAPRARGAMPEAAGRCWGSRRSPSSSSAMLQLMGNQFGIDRDGFRVFVLCGGPPARHPAGQEPGPSCRWPS